MSESTTTTSRPAAPAAGSSDNRSADSRGAGPSTTGRSTQQRRPAAGGRRERTPRRRKFCKFCADTELQIDHKDPEMLGRFVTDRFKILPARVTGTCAKHQRRMTTAIKRARQLALLACTPLHKS